MEALLKRRKFVQARLSHCLRNGLGGRGGRCDTGAARHVSAATPPGRPRLLWPRLSDTPRAYDWQSGAMCVCPDSGTTQSTAPRSGQTNCDLCPSSVTVRQCICSSRSRETTCLNVRVEGRQAGSRNACSDSTGHEWSEMMVIWSGQPPVRIVP